MDKKVTILMATYNGEKYIEEQLLSIINQSYQNWELIIGDDGSTDRTMEIVGAYSERDNRISVIRNNHLGSCQNFATLLQHNKKKEYIMFSDQDDIWDLNKVLYALECMEKEEKKHGADKPILIYSKQILVNSNGEAFRKQEKIYSNDLKTILCQCHIRGCCILMNRNLISLVGSIPHYVSNHDYWVALYAAKFGLIVREEKSIVKYRLHDFNVTGGKRNYGIINKILGWKKVTQNEHKDIVMRRNFAELFPEDKILMEYNDLFEGSIIMRIKKLQHFNYRRATKLATYRGCYNLLRYKVYD